MLLLTPLFHAILLFSLFLLVEVKKLGGKPLLLIGALVDISFNLTWATLLFWQIPHETFFSQRVSNNKNLAGSKLNLYRAWLASFICNVLNHYLPSHCKG